MRLEPLLTFIFTFRYRYVLCTHIHYATLCSKCRWAVPGLSFHIICNLTYTFSPRIFLTQGPLWSSLAVCPLGLVRSVCLYHTSIRHTSICLTIYVHHHKCLTFGITNTTETQDWLGHESCLSFFVNSPFIFHYSILFRQ